MDWWLVDYLAASTAWTKEHLSDSTMADRSACHWDLQTADLTDDLSEMRSAGSKDALKAFL